MTTKPIYEVRHLQEAHYPWGFHYRVHTIRPDNARVYVPCGPKDPRLEPNVVGLFDVGASGAVNFRGRYTSLRDALGGLIIQALSGLEHGRYDPYNNGIPLAAVNVMLIKLSNDEISLLLQCPDLLCDVMRQLAEAVDRAISEAVEKAAEEVFSSRERPDEKAANELLQKAESGLGVLSMARNRAAALGRTIPLAPADFLWWAEDEARVLGAVPSSSEVTEYINGLQILALRLRALGCQPCEPRRLTSVQAPTAICAGVTA